MTTKPKKEPDFEVSLNRLSELSNMLSENEITLENALTLYEEGTSLIKHCNNLLENAEKRIKTIDISKE